ncbi:MAG: hypothetical protein K1Y02_25025 [Candidatus Hydrogenedentes bacterium]|nr:hypothetical protein [Candidatus Hydrogenedentota bacterium]
MSIVPRGIVMLWWLHTAASWRRLVAGCMTWRGAVGCAAMVFFGGLWFCNALFVDRRLLWGFFDTVPPFLQGMALAAFFFGLLAASRKCHLYASASMFHALLSGPYTYRQAVVAAFVYDSPLYFQMAAVTAFFLVPFGFLGLGLGVILAIQFTLVTLNAAGQIDSILHGPPSAKKRALPRLVSLLGLARLSAFVLVGCLVWRILHLTQDGVNRHLVGAHLPWSEFLALPEMSILTVPLYPYLRLMQIRGLTQELLVWGLACACINAAFLSLQVALASPRYEFLQCRPASALYAQRRATISSGRRRGTERRAFPFLPFPGNAAAVTWQMGTCMLRRGRYALLSGPVLGMVFALVFGLLQEPTVEYREIVAAVSVVPVMCTLYALLLLAVDFISEWKTLRMMLTMPFDPVQMIVARIIPCALGIMWIFLCISLPSGVAASSGVSLVFALFFAVPIGVFLSALAHYLSIRFPVTLRPTLPNVSDEALRALFAFFTALLLFMLGLGVSAGAGYGMWVLTNSLWAALIAAATALLAAGLALVMLCARAFEQLPSRLEALR